MSLRFAMDECFPPSVLEGLAAHLPNIEVRRTVEIDTRLKGLHDVSLLLALGKRLGPPRWSALITSDPAMASDPAVLCAVKQIGISLVTTAIQDPLRACALFFLHVGNIAGHIKPGEGRIWQLGASNKAPSSPMALLAELARKRKLDRRTLYESAKLSDAELAHNPITQGDPARFAKKQEETRERRRNTRRRGKQR